MVISKIIKAKGFTIQEVADKLGIAKGTLAAMIANSANPTTGTLRRIAEAIGCNVTDFFSDEVEQVQEGAKTSIHVCPHCGKELKIHID